MSGSPNVRGLTIDTASDTQPIIDEWGTNDVSSKSNYILLCKRARLLNINILMTMIITRLVSIYRVWKTHTTLLYR